MANENNEIILYRPDSTVSLEVRVEEETVWLSQKQIAELFGTKPQAITRHLKNIYSSRELDKDATCSKMEQVQIEGSRTVRRNIEIYNLDAIPEGKEQKIKQTINDGVIAEDGYIYAMNIYYDAKKKDKRLPIRMGQ